MEYELYGKIDDNQALLADSLYNYFYALKQNSFMAEAKEVEHDTRGLNDIDSAFVASNANTNSSVVQLLSAVRNELILLKNAIDSNLTTVTHIANLNTYLLQIENLLSISDSIIAYKENVKNNTADGILADNDLLVESNNLEENEKQTNSITLSTIAQSILEFTQDQITMIRQIADQCPLAGGDAVMRARTLRILIDGYVTYNDKETCNAQGIQMRQAKPAINAAFSLYPNPTNNSITVTYTLPKDCQATLEIIDAFGKLILTQNILAEIKAIQLSTESFAAGTYTVTVNCDDAILNKQRLTIIK